MTADPDLWRATVTTAGFAMPEVPEPVEDEAVSVSMFELEDAATADPVGWQIDLLFREPPDRDQLAARLAPALAEASATLKLITVKRVAPEEWARATELRLPPVTAGRFVVHGSHARGLWPAGTVPIEIDAGLAFGSGEHATTQSCLTAIDRLAGQRRFKRVLDVGCGSGVLAIAAAKCWPAKVLAIDNDPIAVRVARANADLNGVGMLVRTELAEGYAHPSVRRHRPYDLILANILADPLIELAPALRAHLAPGGRAVLSGLLERQADSVIAAHRRQGLRLFDHIRQGPWTALVLGLSDRADPPSVSIRCEVVVAPPVGFGYRPAAVVALRRVLGVVLEFPRHAEDEVQAERRQAFLVHRDRQGEARGRVSSPHDDRQADRRQGRAAPGALPGEG